MQPSMFQCSPEWNSMGYNVLRLGHHIIVYMYSSRGVLWYCGTGLVHTGLCTGWFKYKPCTGTPVLILLHLVQFYKIASPSNSQQLTATQRNLWGSHKICNSAQLHAIAHGNGIRPPVAKIPTHLTLFCSNIALPYVTYLLLCYSHILTLFYKM